MQCLALRSLAYPLRQPDLVRRTICAPISFQGIPFRGYHAGEKAVISRVVEAIMELSEVDFGYLETLFRQARGQSTPHVPISVSLRLSKYGFAAQDSQGNMRITLAGQKYVRDRRPNL